LATDLAYLIHTLPANTDFSTYCSRPALPSGTTSSSGCAVRGRGPSARMLILPEPTIMQASKRLVVTHQPSRTQDSTQNQNNAEAEPSASEQSTCTVADSSSSGDGEHQHTAASQVLPRKHSSLSESRSHANLQQLVRGETIKTCMENINRSLGSLTSSFGLLS
jgi:hypothetical protein